MSPTECDVVVLGAGAAGMYCALTAARRGRRVVLLEHNDRVGQKIAISGGGRCNFTNIHAGPGNYLSENPDFCRSALARFSPWDFIGLVEKHGIAYHEKKLGQQFCTTSSRQIIEMLVAECRSARVEIHIGCEIRRVSKNDRFVVETSRGLFSSESLVVATGGLSFAKLGATDLGYRLARQFGLRVTELRPGLVPLTFASEDEPVYRSLSGVALPVKVRCNGTTFEEAMLFTHRGVSGPAILQISSYRGGEHTLEIDLLPEEADFAAGESRNTKVSAVLARKWPRRFGEAWCARELADKPIQHFKKNEWRDLVHRLHHWPLRFSGTEGYPKAEVTLGGVDTRDLSSKTMEARPERGLFFIGEVVDVTGWLGGYNFQWAWASAHAAGLVV